MPARSLVVQADRQVTERHALRSSRQARRTFRTICVPHQNASFRVSASLTDPLTTTKQLCVVVSESLTQKFLALFTTPLPARSNRIRGLTRIQTQTATPYSCGPKL